MTNAYSNDPAMAGRGSGPAQHVVQVVSRASGCTTAVMCVLTLLLFVVIFITGIAIGLLFSSAPGFMLNESYYRPGDRNTIAILPIEGAIDGTMASFVHHAVDQILDDTSIKAVVLRVDSGGGGVTASDQIWAEVERLKRGNGRAMPVVASFGGIAASGGYYVSCAADTIMAEPTCTTGSIGVIAQVLTFGEAFDKLGIEPVTVVAGDSPEKDVANNTFRVWGDADRDSMQVMLDAAYDIFNKRVRDGRKNVLDAAAVNELADGSVYTADQAKANGLIDSIGYLDDAIAEAERRANLGAGRATVTRLNMPYPSMFDMLTLERAASEQTFDAKTIRSMLDELSAPRAMFLMR